MGRIMGTYVFPHPPLIVPEVGRGEEAGLLKPLKPLKAAGSIAAAKAFNCNCDNSACATVSGNIFIFLMQKVLEGNLEKFRAKEVNML